MHVPQWPHSLTCEKNPASMVSSALSLSLSFVSGFLPVQGLPQDGSMLSRKSRTEGEGVAVK